MGTGEEVPQQRLILLLGVLEVLLHTAKAAQSHSYQLETALAVLLRSMWETQEAK